MPDFVPGLALCDRFFHEAVRPALDEAFPTLDYAAALIGSGSEILGFDTEMSSDHHWGPRAMLFLSPADHAQYAEPIRETLRGRLPYTFMGYPVNFADPDPNDNGTQLLVAIDSGPVNHRVEVYTLDGFLRDYLGMGIGDIDAGLAAADWLTIPGQKLRTVTGGAVYHDGPGDLTRVRAALDYYPRDVWLYLMAAGWARIGQEEPFLGRTGYAGDDLGSRVIAARLAQDVMNLCFLMERQYAPYSKWFGTAFARLDCYGAMGPHLDAALRAEDWQSRERGLNAAWERLAALHNALGLTDPLPETVSPFFGRPFKVIHADNFVVALIDRIEDSDVRRIAQQTHIGAVEQFSTSTDLLSSTALCRRARALFHADSS